jgi:large subunit ribosomal protein L13
MGKHRPTYTPHIDTGDYVIVTNVDKVVFTGNKWHQKTYQRYSGHPGGQKDEVAWKLFQRRPDRILQLAVQRMMPKNKIGRHMLSKMKLYVGAAHPHQAQGPIPLEALSGRPTPAGAVYAVKPEPKTKATQARTRTPAATSAPAEPAPAEPAAVTTVPAEVAEALAPQATGETPPPTSAETPSVAESATDSGSGTESSPAAHEPAAGQTDTQSTD